MLIELATEISRQTLRKKWLDKRKPKENTEIQH